MKMTDHGLVEDWSCEDVGFWLGKQNLAEYRELFCLQHRIDGKALLSITEEDLKSPPVQISALGDIKKIIRLVDELRFQVNVTSDFSSSSSSCQANGKDFKRILVRPTRPTKKCQRPRPYSDPNGSINKTNNGRGSLSPRAAYERIDSFSPDEEDGFTEEERVPSKKMSELTRTSISVVYWWSSLLFTSFVMTLAHDRVPDMKTYPPLPDVILDNLPFIPLAFEMCEYCAVLLAAMWITILIFHKYRLVLIRRMCALSGTVFLLRAFTMYVTSMSVPGVHLECSSQVYGNFSSRLKRALEIFFGMGMSLSGVRSCGDYMFSGHTTVVTMLNFFITEYTPRRWYFLHTFCWLLNAFAVFFILAAHEHYTIDVVIAFYISSRLFLYYHTLACAPFFRKSDENRAKIWFPLFWFFESDSSGRRIPHEFEWPFRIGEMLTFMKKESDGGKSD